MRLNLYLRGVDIIDVEFHAGSKGVYLDLNVFQPRKDDPGDEPVSTTADLSGTSTLITERVEQETWADDQPAIVKFGFQR